MSEKGLIKKLPPTTQLLLAFPTGTGQVLLCKMAGVCQWNHFKCGSFGLKRYKKENPLGIKRCEKIPILPSWSDPIEHPKCGMAEIPLCAHESQRTRTY
jgi:hypothetical protein